MKNARAIGVGIVVIPLLLAAGCDDEPGSAAASGPPCQQLASRMCTKARECAAGTNTCGWRDDGGSTSRNCSVCENGPIDRLCNDPTKTPAQIDACAAAFDRATCEEPGTASLVQLPAECKDVLDCGGGPCKN